VPAKIRVTKEMELLLEEHIEVLGLEVRDSNQIQEKLGVRTVLQLLMVPEKKFLDTQQIGKSTLVRVRKALAAYGFHS